jgi:hypothetical protein
MDFAEHLGVRKAAVPAGAEAGQPMSERLRSLNEAAVIYRTETP